MHLPNLYLVDGGAGVGDPRPGAPADWAVPLPSALCVASGWDPKVAFAGGAMIGEEARQKRFNVLLAGGANLVRDPRDGRIFEYSGEDPLPAGRLAGSLVRGVQSRDVISTVKHFVLNDLETGRMTVSAGSDWGATHSTLRSALAGSDQEPAGHRADSRPFFREDLEQAVKTGDVPEARVRDMAHRGVGSMPQVDVAA